MFASQASLSSTLSTFSTITMLSSKTIAKIRNMHNRVATKPNHET
jgi:hypothetical protein